MYNQGDDDSIAYTLAGQGVVLRVSYMWTGGRREGAIRYPADTVMDFGQCGLSTPKLGMGRIRELM